MPIELRGLDLASPVNRIRAGFCALLVNCRAYLKGAVLLRTLLSNALVTLSNAILAMKRLNDTTPQGPATGYALIINSGTNLSIWSPPAASPTLVASGLSGNPVSMIAFRPDASVRPYIYTGDTSQAVTLTASGFTTNGMLKISSTGTTYKAGIKEPQVAPIVGIQTTTVTQWLSLPANTPPWTNIGGVNALYNYSGTDPQPPYPAIIATPVAKATVTLTVTGTATVNGAVHGPGDTGPATTGYPGQYCTTPAVTVGTGGSSYLVGDVLTIVEGGASGGTVTVSAVTTSGLTTGIVTAVTLTTPGTGYVPAAGLATTGGTGTGCTINVLAVNGSGAIIGASPTIVLYAFTDAEGNIIAQSNAVGAQLVVGSVGASARLTVPSGAAQLQIGIDSQGAGNLPLPNPFSNNFGSYLIEAVVSTSAITPNTGIVGLVTAYIWGDSPHSGPVATYIWRNPNDSGTGEARTIDTASVSANNNSLIFDSTPEDGTVPVLWSTLNPDGSTLSTINLFSPALESAGYQDFNCCIVGNLFFPAGGTYNMTIQYKDQMLFGMGGGVTSPNQPTYGALGQAITVANAYPLLDVGVIDGSGGHHTDTFTISVPALGVYPFEFDWDYWEHTGRSLIAQIAATAGGSATTVPPLPQGVRTSVEYAYKYRSSATGAVSNPSPTSNPQQTPVLANTVQSAFSTDPQVDKVDYYRQDAALTNFTYVATGPNDGLGGTVNGVVMNTAIVDELSDTGAAANPLMQFDDFEPVPSIDTPKSGLVTIVGGVVTWKSGDQFNTRWLPGTIILIGSPTQMAYTFIARPTSTTTVVIPDVADSIGTNSSGNGVAYNIAEPILGNQPLPYLFGPSDNINFAFGVGDPYRPGTLYWSKGNNLDSWPDTNQQDVTDPSEALVNGAMSAGLGVLFSIKRAWVILPNFFNAEATATGTSGSTWTLQDTSISRGLYIPRCVAVEGGGNIFFRVEDGVHVSARGSTSQSITDLDLYPLFSHEGSTPIAVTRNGTTIYPPDDTQPNAQTFNIFAQFLYWDYIGTDNNPHTLVYDIEAQGWIYDLYSIGVKCHAANEGESVQGILAGCTDFTVRQMLSSGAAETSTATVITPAIGGQGYMHCGRINLEYSSTATATLALIAVDTQNGSYGWSGLVLPSTNGTVQKARIMPPANKWKLAQFRFDFSDPNFQLFLEGFAPMCKPWGSTSGYAPIQPFNGASGGLGGQS